MMCVLIATAAARASLKPPLMSECAIAFRIDVSIPLSETVALEMRKYTIDYMLFRSTCR